MGFKYDFIYRKGRYMSMMAEESSCFLEAAINKDGKDGTLNVMMI